MVLVQAGILLAGVVVGALAYVRNISDRRKLTSAVLNDDLLPTLIADQKDIAAEVVKVVDELRKFRRMIEAFLQSLHDQRSAPDKYVHVLTEIRDGLSALNRRQTEEMERMQRLLSELGDKIEIRKGGR